MKEIGNCLKSSVLIMFFLMSWVQAQSRLEVRVSKNSLKIGEATQIDYIFNASGEDFTPPQFNYFRVSGPMVSESQNYINGNYSAYQQYSYVIQATKSGKFIIPSASIYYKGKIYKSSPATIQVSSLKMKNSNEEEKQYVQHEKPKPTLKNRINLTKSPVFIEANLNKTNCYINEPIEVEYRIFINPNYRIQQENKVTFPKMINFWSQNNDVKNSDWERTLVNGSVYYSKLFRKSILYPQKTGSIAIEPLSVDLEIAYPTGNFDFFDDPVYASTRKVVKSNSNQIKVNPLPVTNKPNDFSGAVGHFNLEVQWEKSNLKTGESVQVEVVVAGEGNLKLFEMPQLILPDYFEVFEPKHEEFVQENSVGMQGKIIDTYTVIPIQKGVISVPEQKFSYFDTQSKTYKTITTQSLTFKIKQGDAFIGNAIPNKTKSKSITGELKAISTQTDFTLMKSNKLWNNKWFVASLLLPVALSLFLVLRKKNNIEKNNQLVKEINKGVVKSTYSLTQIENAINNKEEFYKELNQEINSYIYQKFNINCNNWSIDEIENYLLQQQFDKDKTAEIINLLNVCQNYKYAPFGVFDTSNDFAQFKKIIV